MPNTLFAVILGGFALYALFAAFRTPGGRQKIGWLVLALASAAQVVNLLSAYSSMLAVVSTAAILVGLWMIRYPAGPTPHV